jgi:hypothetical protein
LDKKPNAVGVAIRNRLSFENAIRSLPSSSFIRSTFAVLAWNDPCTLTDALGPKNMPAGFRKNRLAPGIEERIAP